MIPSVTVSSLVSNYSVPSYSGQGLVNLVAEIERRMIGTSPMPGLSAGVWGHEHADGYVLMIIDGLGDHQLGHPAATSLASSRAATITAGFPTTTTTSLATVATGLAPAGHGIIGHVMQMPPVSDTVNVLKWITSEGRPVRHDYASVLPTPNLWERLAAKGVEPITVQPGPFMDSPLTKMLYRGCRFEPVWSVDELVPATVDLAGPGRLVVAYYPNVDVAAHVSGQDSAAYREALDGASRLWEQLSLRLDGNIGLVGTADHGHLDYSPDSKILLRQPRYNRLRFFGDPRSMYVSGPAELIDELSAETGSRSVEIAELMSLLGPGLSHPGLEGRLPDRLLLAPDGKLLLPRPFDKRLIGYHGGLRSEELEIPLLVR